ncbi:gp587 [Bacillus phage G]|uniref:Gp587 n=1 Tax=Bacillus phage G TaxID=2884420 RepID=G3MAW7_9CAUD|nr:gp587 [Bacillus phage G]AEO93832.1 gp587 [Bacillus phage G]
MANRQQRRAGKKLLNKPEVKQYVDQFCMEFSSMLVESCEVAREEAKANNTKIDFEKMHNQLEPLMRTKGEELGKKVQEMVQKQNNKSKISFNSYTENINLKH